VIESETALWLIVDAALAAAIVMLAARYVKKRRKKERNYWKKAPQLDFLLEQFNAYLADGDRREAVIKTFNQLVDRLIVLSGGSLPVGLTQREIVSKISSNLTEDLREWLIKMYNIYEYVRFGNAPPSEDEVIVFGENLRAVIDNMRTWGGII